MKETLTYLLRNNCIAVSEGRGVECTGVPGLVLQIEMGAEGSTLNSFQGLKDSRRTGIHPGLTLEK